jgi:hypothetical protein
MGKHSRTGPPGPPPEDRPKPPRSDDADNADALAPFHRRRQPPIQGARIHRPLHGGASHLDPEQPRLLSEWDGYSYVPAGIAADLAEARDWVAELPPDATTAEAV